MGTIGDCFDNSAVESFFGTMQIELLDEHRWDTGKQLARHVRLDRGLVQPIETALVLRDAQPCRLRTDPHARRSCGVINTTNLSAGPGEAHVGLLIDQNYMALPLSKPLDLAGFLDVPFHEAIQVRARYRTVHQSDQSLLV